MKVYSIIISIITCWHIVCMFLDVAYDNYPLFDTMLVYGLNGDYSYRVRTMGYCTGIQECSSMACHLYSNLNVSHIVMDPLPLDQFPCSHYNIVYSMNNNRIQLFMSIFAVTACLFKIGVCLLSRATNEYRNAVDIAERIILVLIMYLTAFSANVRTVQTIVSSVILSVASIYDVVINYKSRSNRIINDDL